MTASFTKKLENSVMTTTLELDNAIREAVSGVLQDMTGLDEKTSTHIAEFIRCATVIATRDIGGVVLVPCDERDIRKRQQFIYRSDLKEALQNGPEFRGGHEWMSDVPVPVTARDVDVPIPAYVAVVGGQS